MAIFWMSVIVLIFLYDQSRVVRKKTVVDKYRFKLFELRDELRELAMAHKVDHRNWVFQYLDSSIAKTIGVLPWLSLWRMLAMWLIYRRDSTIKNAGEQLQFEFQKQQNAELKKIHGKYASVLGEYFLYRHQTIQLVATQLVALVLVHMYIAKPIIRVWNEMVRVVTEAPSTSTFADYAATDCRA